MSVFVVERYWPGVSASALAELADRLRIATLADGDVRYLGSVLLVGDDVVECRFEAAHVDAVRRVNDAAHAAYDRLLLARLPEPSLGEQRAQFGTRGDAELPVDLG